MSQMTFRNPQNNYEESFSTLAAFWITLLLGPIYFLIRGVWTHAVVSVIFAFLTYGISWLIYPFFASGIVKKSYLKKGWILVEP